MSSTTETQTVSSRVIKQEETVGQYLDRNIEVARKRVESLCITKAKLEAVGMLNVPSDLLADALFG